MLGVSYVMTFYVDACAPVYFQFHPRSVGRSVDPGTKSRHFGDETIGAETKIAISCSAIKVLSSGGRGVSLQ